jgi:hypothetical protein
LPRSPTRAAQRAAGHGDRALPIALGVAALWSLVGLIGAAVVPLYRFVFWPTSATLAAAGHSFLSIGGPAALVPVGAPLAGVALVAFDLHRRAAQGRPTGDLTRGVTVCLWLVSVLAFATIGLFVVPVAALLGFVGARSRRLFASASRPTFP